MVPMEARELNGVFPAHPTLTLQQASVMSLSCGKD